MKHTINKEALQSIYGEPSQQLTDQVTRTLRNLPEKETRALPMRSLRVAAVAMALIVLMATGAVAMTGGSWNVIRQWLKLDALQTEAAEEVLYETDQVRFVLVEKTLIGNELVLAVLWQPKAPGLMVIPKLAVSKSFNMIDDIMTVPMGKMRANGVKDEDRQKTLQAYLEEKQLTPVWAAFYPTYYDFNSLVVVWQECLQDDGSVMTYITINGIDSTKPLTVTFSAGEISHETMAKEYGYLNSNVPTTDGWCRFTTRTIDLPAVVNAVPQRIADPQTFVMEQYDTTVTISDLQLYVLPNGWSVQYHAAVHTALDQEHVRIKPMWPQLDNVTFSGDPWESHSEWKATGQGLECDYNYMMMLGNKFTPETPDEIKLQVSLKGYLKTFTLPLKPVE